jgi:GH25 family lysozyme M1 (1,4-beta-N-acetylmuramidase)
MNVAHDHTMGSTVDAFDTNLSKQNARTNSLLASPLAMPGGVQGLDVSGWQVLNAGGWRDIWNNGARFAYVKATESTDYTSSQFGEQYTDSFNQGLIRGAYHFATPNTSSGAAQANFFVDHGGTWSADGRTLPPLLDIEYNPYGATCYGLSQQAMVSWIADFSSTVHSRTGRLPAIYSTTNWWSQCTGNSSAFSANPLFIARYTSNVAGGPGSLPASWSQYTFWQYADAGTFPGDQDVFNGTEDSLRGFAGSGSLSLAAAAPESGSTVAVAESASGARYTFWKGADGYVWENVWNGYAWSGPTTTGGYIGPGSGLTADVESGGGVSVFWRGGDGAIWIAASASGGWQAVTQVSAAPTGVAFSSPAAAISGSGTQYVFWKGSDGYLYQSIRATTTWTKAARLAAYVGPGTSLSAGIDGAGSTYVYWRGGDNGIWEANWGGSGWTTAHQLPSAQSGSVFSEVGIAITPWGARYAFWRGSNGQLLQSVCGGQAWTGPFDLGVYLGPATAVAASVDGSGNTAVSWLGGDSGVWESHWVGRWSQATRIQAGG